MHCMKQASKKMYFHCTPTFCSTLASVVISICVPLLELVLLPLSTPKVRRWLLTGAQPVPWLHSTRAYSWAGAASIMYLSRLSIVAESVLMGSSLRVRSVLSPSFAVPR